MSSSKWEWDGDQEASPEPAEVKEKAKPAAAAAASSSSSSKDAKDSAASKPRAVVPVKKTEEKPKEEKIKEEKPKEDKPKEKVEAIKKTTSDATQTPKKPASVASKSSPILTSAKKTVIEPELNAGMLNSLVGQAVHDKKAAAAASSSVPIPQLETIVATMNKKAKALEEQIIAAREQSVECHQLLNTMNLKLIDRIKVLSDEEHRLQRESFTAALNGMRDMTEQVKHLIAEKSSQPAGRAAARNAFVGEPIVKGLDNMSNADKAKLAKAAKEAAALANGEALPVKPKPVRKPRAKKEVDPNAPKKPRAPRKPAAKKTQKKKDSSSSDSESDAQTSGDDSDDPHVKPAEVLKTPPKKRKVTSDDEAPEPKKEETAKKAKVAEEEKKESKKEDDEGAEMADDAEAQAENLN